MPTFSPSHLADPQPPALPHVLADMGKKQPPWQQQPPSLWMRWWHVRSRLKALGVVVVLLVLLLPVAARPALAQDEPPDLDTYAALVREAFAAAQRNDRLGLEDVSRTLIAVKNVRLPNGSVRVDNTWLARQLDTTDPDMTLIAARLGAIIDALAQPDSAVPADAQARLDAILNNPPFAQKPPQQTERPGWLKAIGDTIGAFFTWLGEQLDNLFGTGTSSAPGSLPDRAWVRGAFVVIAMLLLGGVVVYVVFRLRRSLVSDARVASDDPDANLTSGEAMQQASSVARGGDHRTAVRYMYLSALLWMDEHDLLRYDRALTNREYLDRVRENPALQGHLAPIIDTFDRVWYGHAPIDDASFAAYQQQVAALRSLKIGAAQP